MYRDFIIFINESQTDVISHGIHSDSMDSFINISSVWFNQLKYHIGKKNKKITLDTCSIRLIRKLNLRKTCLLIFYPW